MFHIYFNSTIQHIITKFYKSSFKSKIMFCKIYEFEILKYCTLTYATEKIQVQLYATRMCLHLETPPRLCFRTKPINYINISTDVIDALKYTL